MDISNYLNANNRVLMAVLFLVFVYSHNYDIIRTVTKLSVSQEEYEKIKESAKGIKRVTLSNHCLYVPRLIYGWFVFSTVVLVIYIFIFVLLKHLEIESNYEFTKYIPFVIGTPNFIAQSMIGRYPLRDCKRKNVQRMFLKKEYKYRKKK